MSSRGNCSDSRCEERCEGNNLPPPAPSCNPVTFMDLGCSRNDASVTTPSDSDAPLPNCLANFTRVRAAMKGHGCTYARHAWTENVIYVCTHIMNMHTWHTVQEHPLRKGSTLPLQHIQAISRSLLHKPIHQEFQTPPLVRLPPSHAAAAAAAKQHAPDKRRRTTDSRQAPPAMPAELHWLASRQPASHGSAARNGGMHLRAAGRGPSPGDHIHGRTHPAHGAYHCGRPQCEWGQH